MSVVSLVPGDVRFIVALVSTTTVYPSRHPAYLAAIALSNANANASVQIARANELVAAATGIGQGQLASDQPPGGGCTGETLIQLAPGTTYYPLESARQAALTISGANAGGPVLIARIHATLTAV